MTLEITCQTIHNLDGKLSNRFIALDPKGYCIIKVDTETKELVIEHFINEIDDEGRAIDPETGKPIDCHASRPRSPSQTYRGQSAKELGIKLTEGEGPHPISRLDHAVYLGRELQKAENCLLNEQSYIQD